MNPSIIDEVQLTGNGRQAFVCLQLYHWKFVWHEQNYSPDCVAGEDEGKSGYFQCAVHFLVNKWNWHKNFLNLCIRGVLMYGAIASLSATHISVCYIKMQPETTMTGCAKLIRLGAKLKNIRPWPNGLGKQGWILFRNKNLIMWTTGPPWYSSIKIHDWC